MEVSCIKQDERCKEIKAQLSKVSKEYNSIAKQLIELNRSLHMHIFENKLYMPLIELTNLITDKEHIDFSDMEIVFEDGNTETLVADTIFRLYKDDAGNYMIELSDTEYVGSIDVSSGLFSHWRYHFKTTKKILGVLSYTVDNDDEESE